MAIKLMSSRRFHLEKSFSATTATTNDCTVLNTHCVTVTRMELLDADATVADVNFMLTLYRFKLNVFL